MLFKLKELTKKSNKLLLLSFDWTRPKDPPMSLGQASLVAKLHQENIPVIDKSWAVNSKQFRVEDAFRFVMAYAGEKVDLAMGAYVWHEPHTQALLAALKRENFPGRIILGGPQVTYTKQNLESYYPQADIFIRGYGEDALARLFLSTSGRPPIAGVHYAGEPDLGLSANIALDQLPSPYLTGIIKPQPFIRWETQRGCPFQCAFCQHRESDSNVMKRRQLGYARVMEETQWILDNPIIQDIAVLDPVFNSGPHYMAILRQLIAGGYSGKIALQCRIEMVKDEFLEAISILNQTAKVVLEFGLQTIHSNEAKIIQRPNNMQKVKQVLLETRARNIATEVSLIFGLPGQTLSSFKESIAFCKDYGVPTIYAYPLMLLRGTPLHAAKESLQLVESSDIDLQIDRLQQGIPHVISSPTFSYEDWCAMAEMAETLDQYNAKAGGVRDKKASPKMRATLESTFLWQAREQQKNLQ
ncbi:hypothetical protein CYY_001322 [Polysphondylium violaceum]|uniref:Radical SAM domain protein n=1 Tax=Polysphondylium violaceum TaxID=133409 RepID=A0A8J4Q3H5_9MYCE|nr:hypothetical protein CYY_001322 [Polysphondylium violaceum]